MKADLILVNGAIHTMDRAKPRAEAIAIAGNRVFAVGSNAEMRDLKAPGCRMVDLRGGTVVPGLTDAHLHFLAYGISLREIDLAGVATLDEALARVAARRGRDASRSMAPRPRLGSYLVGPRPRPAPFPPGRI